VRHWTMSGPPCRRMGGDVEFVGVSDAGTVRVKLAGACGSCPMAQMALKMGIERCLEEKVPEAAEAVAF